MRYTSKDYNDEFDLATTLRVDNVMSCTDDFLNLPHKTAENARIAQERYEEACSNASGVTGIRYDRDRVQTSHYNSDDALVRMIEEGEKLQNAQMLYTIACINFNRMLSESHMSEKEQKVMYLTHVVELTQADIGRTMNLSQPTVFYWYKKAFVKASQWCEKMGMVYDKYDCVPMMKA